MLNSDIRVSLQKRLLKKTAVHIENLATKLQGLDDGAQSWMSYLSAYGEARPAPFQIEINPYERAGIEDFVQTENDLFGKVVVALSVVACELRFLTFEAKQRFLDPLVHYSDEYVDNAPSIVIGKFLSFLQELCCFKTRCKEIITLFLQQLNALGDREFGMAAVIFLFDCLSELFVCLLTADNIIKTNNSLREHWAAFKASVNACAHSAAMSAKVGVLESEIKDIENLLADIERQVLTGRIFVDCVQDSSKTMLSRKFFDSLSTAITAMIADAENPQSQSQAPVKTGTRVIATGSLVALHCILTRNVDKRLLKLFLDACRMCPVVALWRNISTTPADIILQHIPDVMKHVDKKQLQVLQTGKDAALQFKLQTLAKDVLTYRTEVMQWIEQIQTISREVEPVINEEAPRMLRSGLLLARKIQNSGVQIFHYHSVLLKPMTRSTLLLLGNMMEMLMVLHGCLDHFGTTITQLTDRFIEVYTSRMQTACSALEKRLGADKRSNFGAVEQVDALTALKIMQQTLTSGPLTPQRLVVVRICLGVCTGMKKWSMDELHVIQATLPVVKDFCNFQQTFRTACDTSMFYWNKQVLRPYLEEVYQNPGQASKLFCLLAAFEASTVSLRTIRHEDPSVVIGKFRVDVKRELDDCVLNQLCKEVETNLRLMVHSHLALPDRNPFESAVRDLRMFIFLGPIYFLNDCISVRDHVEKYLDRTFYDLTTVSLHDWKTYDEMRSLASHLYDLNVIHANLPCQTLEQGADVLEIMRNMNFFVSSYAYNLNNQIFVERTSNSKHLNTIGIRHVANSLRTHGIGVMNTTVNYTYQFLRKKFNLFSQFMFDEHIKSRLIKDIKIFKDMKQGDAMAQYPFERAEKFNKAIRTLGVSQDNQTRLDQFRTLITHIGNAMGFVRTVRSGGLHHCSKAICFIPDLEDIESFEDLAKEENFENIRPVAKDLDEIVTVLSKNLSDGTEFFKLLLEVFSGEFRHVKNRHLQNFYMIIPPLMVNFVEHLVTCKERLQKKNPAGLVLFTDDGFAMGVAYILALLDQNAQFDSLNWIDAVRNKFRQDVAAASETNKPQIQGGRSDLENDEKLKQALRLTARRLESYIKEFELLFFSLSSARIFFKTTTSLNPATKEPTLVSLTV